MPTRGPRYGPRAPLNVNQEFATLRDDGAYVFGGRNLPPRRLICSL